MNKKRWLNSSVVRWLGGCRFLFTYLPIHLSTYLILSTYLPNHLSTYLYALEVGTPAGEVGEFATQQKHFYGDYLSAGPSVEKNIWGSSDTMKREFLSDGSTSYFTDINIVPGNTYYYWFREVTNEQKTPVFRTIYVSSTSPGYILLDGVRYDTTSLITNTTIWHNWANAPPPPSNLTSFWSADNNYISVEWDNPQFSGQNILDVVYGGGYEIYRSTVSYTESLTFKSSVTAISSRMNYTDNDVIAGTSYYYAIRAYDAYRPPLFSSYALTTPVGRRKYLTVNFVLNVSGLDSVRSVQIVGDFTVPPWYPGRLSLSFSGDGTWRLSYSDITTYEGAVIRYKYLLNDEIYEDDMPLALGGPYRVVTLKDEGNSQMTLRDNWSVWTPTTTPSNLPENLVGFSAEPFNNAVRISWDFDPFSTSTILGFNLYRSTVADGPYTLIFSTAQLTPEVSFSTDTVSNGTTVYYKISTVNKAGIESKLSDSIKAIPLFYGSSLPLYNVEDKFNFGNLWGIFGTRTGEAEIFWSAAEAHTHYGPPSSYVIRYATFPILDISAFKKAKLAGIARGFSSGTLQRFTTLNLGNNCPSYYFVAAAVYGGWHLVSLSTSTFIVLPERINSSVESTITKNSRNPGDSSNKIVASIELPHGSFPKDEYLVVVKNHYDLKNDSKYKVKIDAANKLSKSDERFGYLLENETSETSSVFGFELYDTLRRNFFEDKNSDGIPDKFAKKEMTIALSYSGLNVAPEELKIAVLNEKGNFWRILKDVKPEIDRENKLLKFKSRQLSVYGLFKAPKPADDLANVVVYPNPFKPHDNNPATGDYSTGIKFINLTRNARIYIYNIAGELVRQKDLFADKFGECKWDVRNDDDDYVATGVYVFVVKDETVKSGKNKFIGKLGIIR